MAKKRIDGIPAEIMFSFARENPEPAELLFMIMGIDREVNAYRDKKNLLNFSRKFEWEGHYD